MYGSVYIKYAANDFSDGLWYNGIIFSFSVTEQRMLCIPYLIICILQCTLDILINLNMFEIMDPIQKTPQMIFHV